MIETVPDVPINPPPPLADYRPPAPPAPPDLLTGGIVRSSQIVAGAITASQVSVGTITASQIAAGSLSGIYRENEGPEFVEVNPIDMVDHIFSERDGDAAPPVLLEMVDGEIVLWTDEARDRCAERCAEYGDPPCYSLHAEPALVPCDACIDRVEARSAAAIIGSIKAFLTEITGDA